jgi:phosphatidyl-myo-inositol dimannoside synthase
MTDQIPRTLIVTNDFPPRKGGVGRYVFDVVDHLPHDRVRVLAPSHDGDAAFDAELDLPVERFPRARLRPPASLRRRLDDLLRGPDRPEVVLFGHAAPVGLAGPQVAGQGVPYLLLTHGVEYWLARVPGAAWVLGRAASRANEVFAISSFTAESIRRVVPSTVSVSLLPPGVDTERFRPDVDGTWVRERHAIGDRPLVLCVGRLVPRKGQDVLLRGFGQVRRRVPEARLLLVGDGPLRARLRAMVSAEIADAVVFAGEIADGDLPAYYAAADVFATPCRSRWGGLEVEGFGIVFMEAAASGVPSVAGRSGGAAEAVVDGRTGLVVDGTDVHAVAEAVAGLLADSERRAEMGRAGRERAVAGYDWRAIAGRLGERLAAAVAEGPRP